MKQRKIILLIEVIIILLIIGVVSFISNTKKQKLTQDILFLRLFSNINNNKDLKKEIPKIAQENVKKQIEEQEKKEIESFNFTVDYKNTKMQSKEVELSNTIWPKILVQEKIAPRNKRNI